MGKSVVITAVALGALTAVCAWGEWVYEGEWGKSGSNYGEFNFPIGIAVAPGGNVYVTEHFGYRVQRFTAAGSFRNAWAVPWSPHYVYGVAVAADGTVYVTSGQMEYESYIGRFTPAGAILGSWQAKRWYPSSADHVDVSASGTVYVAEGHLNRVSRYNPVGSMVGSWEIDYAEGLALAPDGRVYLTNGFSGNNVRYYASTGSFLGSWGSEGSGNGQLYDPIGVDVAPDGRVYVADRMNQRIQYFTPEGSFLGKWGTRGTGKGQFIGPRDVAVSPGGKRIYVVDSGNDRIQYFRWSDPAVEPASIGRVKALYH
jgi:DNA-binding beta-propeller fold protein YncE